MCFNFCGVKIEVKFLFIAVAALLLLLDNTGVMLCAFLSSAVHELAHLTAMLAFRGEVTEVSFVAFGIRITRLDALLFHEELVMLLAGPAANILLFFLCSTSSSQTVSLIAAVNLSIGIFNLLPVGSLDGGRVASLVSAHLLGEQKGRLAALILSIVILTVLLAAGVWLLLMPNRNFSLLVVCVFLALSLVMDLRARGERVIL